MLVAQKPKPVVQEKYYLVNVDHILGADQPAEGEATPFQFRPIKGGYVSSAELQAANCDVGWLLRIGAITEVGYVPQLGNTDANTTNQ